MPLFRYLLLYILLSSAPSVANRYFVAPDGDNNSGDGSSASPWATIDYAVATIPSVGGDTIIVKDGIYNGRNYLTESFERWVVITAENAYYGFRIGTEGDNPPIDNFFIYNNIWSDPTGTMTNRFIDIYGDVDVNSIVLYNNLFWNADGDLPTHGSVLPADDTGRVVADPELEDNRENIILPVWDETLEQFISGNTTVRQEFERLVFAYGAIPVTSPATDGADGTYMPKDDILGSKRDSLPDIGCFEYGGIVHSTFFPKTGAIPQRQPRIRVCADNTIRIRLSTAPGTSVTFQLFTVSGRKVYEKNGINGNFHPPYYCSTLPVIPFAKGLYLGTVLYGTGRFSQILLFH